MKKLGRIVEQPSIFVYIFLNFLLRARNQSLENRSAVFMFSCSGHEGLTDHFIPALHIWEKYWDAMAINVKKIRQNKAITKLESIPHCTKVLYYTCIAFELNRCFVLISCVCRRVHSSSSACKFNSNKSILKL